MAMDRRAVLTGGALLSAGAAAAAATAASAPVASQPAVDPKVREALGGDRRLVTLEEHYLDLALVEGNPATRQAAAWLPDRLKNRLADLGDARIRDMDENGITIQVISASAPGADLLDGAEGIQFAKATNDFLADAVRRHPGRYAGFAHLPMRSPQAAADELERCVSQLGFRGALINGTTQGQFLDEPPFAPILARAAKLGAPIYLHPALPPKAVHDAYYSGLQPGIGQMISMGAFGWHAETGMHILRIALSGVFERYPGLNMIIGHMGETLPFMLDRLDHIALDFAGMKTPPSEIIRERVYITTAGVFSNAAFLCALTAFGVDRIMFSVDYPYSSPVLATQWFDHVPIAPDDKRKIMHGNADRLLKLGAVA